ncbi:hypothetical protein BDD12DRAFT_657122, partial [Trichophaea hybrida]
AVQLGRLVLNAQHLKQYFFNLHPLSPTDDSIVFLRLESFHHILTQSEGSWFHTFLMKTLSVSFSIKDDSTTKAQAAICQTYQLKNSGEYFRKLCRDNSACQWIEHTIRRQNDISFVVDIKTLTSPMVTQIQRRSINNMADMEIPSRKLSSVIGAGFGGGGSQTNEFKQDTGFEVVGEQVYSVQYQKVQFKKFSSRDVDRTFLKDGNRWKLFVSKRGEEDGYDDII